MRILFTPGNSHLAQNQHSQLYAVYGTCQRHCWAKKAWSDCKLERPSCCFEGSCFHLNYLWVLHSNAKHRRWHQQSWACVRCAVHVEFLPRTRSACGLSRLCAGPAYSRSRFWQGNGAHAGRFGWQSCHKPVPTSERCWWEVTARPGPSLLKVQCSLYSWADFSPGNPGTVQSLWAESTKIHLTQLI